MTGSRHDGLIGGLTARGRGRRVRRGPVLAGLRPRGCRGLRGRCQGAPYKTGRMIPVPERAHSPASGRAAKRPRAPAPPGPITQGGRLLYRSRYTARRTLPGAPHATSRPRGPAPARRRRPAAPRAARASQLVEPFAFSKPSHGSRVIATGRAWLRVPCHPTVALQQPSATVRGTAGARATPDPQTHPGGH
jgi:hypothetical protein